MANETKESGGEINLRGKVALVTGASRGIGARIALGFARAGAKVVIAARKIEGLQDMAETMRAEGHEVLPVAAHMGKNEAVEALFETAKEHFGRVDVMVNNAATNPYFGPMIDVEDWAFEKTFEVNVKGYLKAIREFTRHVRARGGKGSVVNIASVAGFMAMPDQGIYAMTKAAVISMTKTLSVELGPDIRVNAIAPGLIDTRFAAALTEDETMLNHVLERTSLNRLGKPEDIASAALLLASNAGAYFTGSTLTVDGGWSLG